MEDYSNDDLLAELVESIISRAEHFAGASEEEKFDNSVDTKNAIESFINDRIIEELEDVLTVRSDYRRSHIMKRIELRKNRMSLEQAVKIIGDMKPNYYDTHLKFSVESPMYEAIRVCVDRIKEEFNLE